MEPLRLFLSAGEASGDLHGAGLLRALSELGVPVAAACLGGAHLRAAGARMVVENRDFAVIGIPDALRRLPRFYGAYRECVRHFREERPSALVTIDFPDLNLLLARAARRAGVPVFSFIPPQVWAWRPWRTRALRRLVTRAAVILPFEEAYLRARGVPATFVGHPLVDALLAAPSPEEARARYRRGGGPLLALLPGSRRGEIARVLPVIAGAARIVAGAIPGVSFVLPLAPGLAEADLSPHLGGLSVRFAPGDAWGALRACDAALVCSGTATLEAALLDAPTILVYRLPTLDYHIARTMLRVSAVGLPNLIAGERIIPELLQDGATPERLAAEALALLSDPARREAQRRGFSRVRALLGGPGVYARAARLLCETIGS